ncbi:protein max [Drosophila suzukii]|uniref:Protein max n=1 Tax=Drosophila suzukii TaxID=28584 RepID=A0AB40A6G5_DROSZ|nr:protein max [Drosophila suzukii]XP_036672444.1 protein max [Drosophila suzukii]XP_037718270.1 protein max [Drosophila subpulchrella]
MSMSDDDRDIDIESDDDADSDTGLGSSRHTSTANFTQAEKRAHHNALERRRRDHIKESFTNLREAVPTLKGEKASRAQILKKTTECIQTMRRKISDNQKDIEEIRKQNFILDQQIRALESPNGDSLAEFLSDEELESEEAEDDLDQPDFSRRNKKMKTFHA